MRNVSLLMVLLLMALISKAQFITGKIVDDENNEPVDFAAVILQTTDSAYVSFANTDSLGVFKLESDLPVFRLIVQHLAYEMYENIFQDQQPGIVRLTRKAHQLDEISVKGHRALVTVVDGRMTYNMRQLLAGKVVSNAYESLLQLPGIREQSGELVLAGANSLTVIINGKPTTMTNEQLMELLRHTPQSRIEKAEVMYSAPPQCHVRGAVINLVMKQNESDKPDWQGQLNAAYTQRHYDSHSSGITLLYTAPRFSTDLLYSFNHTHIRSGLDLFSHHLYDGQVHTIEQQDRGDKDSQAHHIRLGADYRLTDKNLISFAYTSQLTPKLENREISEGNYSSSVNNKKETDPVQMHHVSLDFTSGSGLKTGIDYTYYKNHTSQDFTENKKGKEDAFIAYSNQDINRLRASIDQQNELSSDWKLNYGGQFRYATDHSSQHYQSHVGHDMSGSDTDNKLNEYTYDLYAGFEKSFTEKFSLSASVTGEYYKLGGFNEWAIFPALEATWLFSPSHILQLSFSSDKVYPDYWEMHGSIGYIDGYAELHGNPQLRPYKDYSAQLNYIIHGKYVITGYYICMDDYFVQLPYQSPEKLALIYQTTNFDNKQTVGVNVVIPLNTGSFLNSRLTLNGFYDQVKSSYFHETAFYNDQWVGYSRLDNTANLSSKPDFKVEIAGAYISKNIQGSSELTALWNLDAGIKWTFAGKNAELRLKGMDLLDTWTPDLTMRYDKQNLRMNIVPDSRTVTLSFSYKFGGYKQKDHKEVDTSRFGKQ